MEHLHICHKQEVNDAEIKIRKWLYDKMFLMVRIDFMFKKNRIFSKKDGKVLSLDASNRIKPIEDGISKMLQFDDRHFFVGSYNKLWFENFELDEWCDVILLPIPRLEYGIPNLSR